METLRKEIGILVSARKASPSLKIFPARPFAASEPLRFRKPETPPLPTSGDGRDKALEQADFKLIVSLGLFGLPLPGPIPFARHVKIMANPRKWDFLQAELRRDDNPWKEILEKMLESEYANPSWTARPRAVPPAPDEGGTASACLWRDQDALAAYVQALLGFITGRQEHARAAAAVLNTWARVASGDTGYRHCHESDWAMLVFSGTREILRRMDDAWADAELRLFAPAFKRACLRH